jgi:hypothetical protein
MSGPIEVGAKRLVYKIGLVLSIVAVAVGSWVFFHMGFFPPVALALAMFTFGTFVFAYLLATGPYVFRIDTTGVHDRSSPLSAGRVAWSEIEAWLVVTAEGRGHVGLVLAASARERRGLLAQGSMQAMRQRHGVDFVIPPEAIGAGSAEELVAMLEGFRTDEKARAQLASATR